ncbi:MAG: MBL fold metallo-hydrolase [Candidatus Riflebacteria bacterium]|nr:MBL fold metallo-hydrolase [Candidatus Riflebacteria bacterium]
MELKALTKRVQVISGFVNIGLIRLVGNRVILIDSGLDRRYAKKVLGLLAGYGYEVAAILNTHAHADHIGGNAFIQMSTGCRVLIGPLEAPAAIHPLIQAIALFGGFPLPDLLNPHVMAEPCSPEILPEDRVIIEDVEIGILDLPGHSVGQKGFLVDGVAFLADTLFTTPDVQKHRLTYLYDPLAQIASCERLRQLNAEWYIGGHFPPTKDIRGMIAENLGIVERALDVLRGLIAMPQPLDRLLKNFLDHFKIKNGGWEHFLYRATLNGYLSALKRLGEADFKVLDNLLIWFGTLPPQKGIIKS